MRIARVRSCGYLIHRVGAYRRMGQKTGQFSILTARVHPVPETELSSSKKVDAVLRARREDYAELWALTDKARALRLVHPSWIAEKAAPSGRRFGLGYWQKRRLMERYLEGKPGLSAPFVTRRWASELKAALLNSGIAETGFPVADLAGLQRGLGIEPAVSETPPAPVAAVEPAPPPPPAPEPVETFSSQIQQIFYGSGPGRARRLDELAKQYCGVYDVVCREQNDAGDPKGGFATRSLLVVHEVEGDSGPEHVVCELVAHLPPGAVARSYFMRAGYAFRLADACVCLLFDAAYMPGFITTDDGKALNVVPRASGGPGFKTVFLSGFGGGSQLTRLTHQTAQAAGVGVARRRSRGAETAAVRLGREDLRALRRFRMSDASADPAENELIQIARQYPMLHASAEEAAAFPHFAGLKR